MRTVNRSVRRSVYLRDGRICVYCDADLKFALRYEITVDHVTPVSRGGRSHVGNLVTCCPVCNTAKGSKLLDEFCDPERADRIRNRIT